LLEASLLRFALSEHFLNVDELLLQSKGAAPAGVKKKLTTSPKAEATAPVPSSKQEPEGAELPLTAQEPHRGAASGDIESIKANWQDILGLIKSKLGPGTAGLLSSAMPSRFENGVLTLEFGPAGQMHKKICESNGRIEQIEALLAEQLSTQLRLKFETALQGPAPAPTQATQPSTPTQKRNDIVNDPAVKMILMGLDATITGIEENQ
jgi:hypothetical protein